MEKKAEGKKNDYPYIAFIQVISALAVIILHANSIFWWDCKADYWPSANILESLFYFAVPCFFMITGITLINFYERYSIKEYLKKRLFKTVVPFIVWSLIGMLWKLKDGYISKEEITVKYVLDNLLSGQMLSVFSFFLSLFTVYLCIPVIAAISKDKRREVLNYAFIAGLFINCIIPFIKSAFKLSFPWDYNVWVVKGELLYVVGGVLLHETVFDRKQRICIYSLGILGLLLHMIGTYQLSINAGRIVTTFKGYNNVPCILYSFAVFLWLKQIGERVMRTKMVKLIRQMAYYTFACYLIHWFILDYMIIDIKVDRFSLLFRLGSPVIVYPVVMLIAYILKKIPIIKKAVP